MARFNSSLRKPRAMFIDLSGTIHVDDHAIPNSISALKKLKDHRIPHIFVTNTSKVNHFLLHEYNEIKNYILIEFLKSFCIILFFLTGI